MAILANNFDGTDAVTLSGSNTATTGDAFTVTLNGGDIEFDTAQSAHGTASALVQPVTSAVTELRWDYTATTTALASFYIRIPSSFSVTSTLCQVRNSTTSAALLRLDTSRRLLTQNSAGTTLNTSAALSVNTWYRVEIRVVRGTSSTDGTIQSAYYLADSTTPVETAYSSTAVNAGTTDLTNVRIGRPSSATTDVTTFWIDSAQLYSGTSDADALGKPWVFQKIPLTATRTSDTATSIAWTHPSDAAGGISIIRCSGTQVNDGYGLTPSDSDYDPTSLAGATTIANSLDNGDNPYADTGLTAGVYTYWVVRTSP